MNNTFCIMWIPSNHLKFPYDANFNRMKYQIKLTTDGSFTIFLPDLNEQYHSLNGAVTESKHVFLKMGFDFHPLQNPVVFEVGFGTGLNALLTAYRAEITGRSVFYTTIEKYPLNIKLVKNLNYGDFIPGRGNELFSAIHECQWDVPVQLTPFFRILKINADFLILDQRPKFKCDIIYFDAFGPDKQPEMWSPQIFSYLFEQLLPEGILVTYSAKGEVRRHLTAAGFKTEKLPGPPGKKEMLRAIKCRQNPN